MVGLFCNPAAPDISKAKLIRIDLRRSESAFVYSNNY